MQIWLVDNKPERLLEMKIFVFSGNTESPELSDNFHITNKKGHFRSYNIDKVKKEHLFLDFAHLDAP